MGGPSWCGVLGDYSAESGPGQAFFSCRAASEAGIEGLDELFVGPTAIAFVTGEPVDAAKAIKTFAKEHKALVIKGGYMDGHRVGRRPRQRPA